MIAERKPGAASGANTFRIGLLLAAAAVLFWSFGSALIYMGARDAGTWQFVFVSTLTAGLLQLMFRYASTRELRTAIVLPPGLWATVLCFVLYGLAWPWALADSTEKQVGGVNLINYLWPILTVVFSVWWVQGTPLTKSVVVSVILALAGLVCANIKIIRELFSVNTASDLRTASYVPFVLASAAAITWAIYSVLLARWRSWTRHYVTSPVGFLSIAAVAAIVLLRKGETFSHVRPTAWATVLCYGIGPLASGYLLWELALARAGVQTPSFIAAATPILSTIVLSWFLRTVPGLDLILAALLISAGVVVSVMDPTRSFRADPVAGQEDNGIQVSAPRGSRDKAPGTS